MVKTWKAVERRVAKKVGGVRVGCTGRATPDVVSPWLSIECKHRARLPAWLKDALAQAKTGAGDDKLGIAILHERYKHDALVVLALSDFISWFGDMEVEDGQEV